MPIQLENLRSGVIESNILLGEGPRPLLIVDMAINNSGTVRATNSVSLALQNVTLNNLWHDYDPQGGGTPSGDPQSLGIVRAEGSPLELIDVTINRGRLETSTFGLIDIAGSATFRGTDFDIAMASSIVVRAGQNAYIDNGPNVSSGVTTWSADSTMELRGELRIEANDVLGAGNLNLVGSNGFAASLIVYGQVGVSTINLATEAGASSEAAIVGSLGESNLSLSGVAIAGRGRIGSDGGDLDVRIFGPDRVALQNEGTLIFDSDLQIDAAGFLYDEAVGDILFNATVGNNGVIQMFESAGSITFGGSVENNGRIITSGVSTTTFNGFMGGAGVYVLDEDATFVLNAGFDGVIEFDADDFDPSGPDTGTLIVNDASGFMGSIKTFGDGDRIGLAEIDFADAILYFDNDPDPGEELLLTITDGNDSLTIRMDPGPLSEYDVSRFSLDARAEGGSWLYWVA